MMMGRGDTGVAVTPEGNIMVAGIRQHTHEKCMHTLLNARTHTCTHTGVAVTPEGNSMVAGTGKIPMRNACILCSTHARTHARTPV